MKSIIEQIFSELHCHSSSSTSSFPSPEQWLSQQEMCLVPSCTLWSGHPDLTNACLLSDKLNGYIDQLPSEPVGYTLLVIPKVSYQERKQTQSDTLVKETPDELMGPYTASPSSQQDSPVLESHLGSHLTSDGLHQLPRLAEQEIEKQFTDDGTKQKVEQLLRDKEHVLVEERVSETEVEDVGEYCGTKTCFQMKKQGTLPGLEHLLMLRTLSPEVDQASSTKLTAVEKEVQKESESDCILVGEESTTNSVEVECITLECGDLVPQQCKHDSVSPGRHYSSAQYNVDSDSDKDLPCIGITSNHKVSPSRLPMPQSETIFSSTPRSHSAKDIIVISGSEDESVKLRTKVCKYHEDSLSSNLKQVAAMSPSSLDGKGVCGSNFLGSLEESRDEGIVMEESVSSSGEDVMMLDMETEVGLQDEQIVSVLKGEKVKFLLDVDNAVIYFIFRFLAELQRSSTPHWNVSRVMRQLRRVFGEAVATK